MLLLRLNLLFNYLDVIATLAASCDVLSVVVVSVVVAALSNLLLF